MKRHTGGTLLGIVIGLLLGLGIALGVAVYVTKVPVPLVDRGVQRKPDQDAIEAERNRNWNPNANLPGQPAGSRAAAPTTPAAPAADGSPATTPPGDPLGDLIQSRTQGAGPVATVTAPNVIDPFIYFVQAGAFRAADEAEAQRARLAMLGFDAQVSEREQAGRPIYRVRLGPFEQKTGADEMQTRLTGQGIETALVRVQR
jgi:cell division protein FtsN